MRRGFPPRPPEDRWLDHVTPADPDACWPWSGVAPGEYGSFKVEGRRMKAHRYAYVTFVGEIPPGLFVCHRCDNPPCVNPAHLFVGTAGDNVRDMHSKGRAFATPPATRGQGAIQRAKTHCPAGHPYDEANTYWRNGGRHRSCRACHRAAGRARRAAEKRGAA